MTDHDVDVAAGGAPPPVAPPGDNGQAPGEVWLTDKNGRAYVKRGGGKAGIIIRQEDGETVEQARARDALPKSERRPRRRPRTPKLPPAPSKIDLKALEQALSEGLKAPGAICASFGDEWGAEHFTSRGPYLARNLVLASQHNPWLREKLEQAASGEDAMMKIVGLLGVGGAFVMYVAPPVIYYLNLRVPDKTRGMLDLPPRRDDQDAATAPPHPPAGDPAGAFPA